MTRTVRDIELQADSLLLSARSSLHQLIHKDGRDTTGIVVNWENAAKLREARAKEALTAIEESIGLRAKVSA